MNLDYIMAVMMTLSLAMIFFNRRSVISAFVTSLPSLLILIIIFFNSKNVFDFDISSLGWLVTVFLFLWKLYQYDKVFDIYNTTLTDARSIIESSLSELLIRNYERDKSDENKYIWTYEHDNKVHKIKANAIGNHITLNIEKVKNKKIRSFIIESMKSNIALAKERELTTVDYFKFTAGFSYIWFMYFVK